MNIAKLLGLNRDLSWPPCTSIAAAAAGSAADYEHAVFVVPNLVATAGSGQAGDEPLAALDLRLLNLVPEAAVTGQATHFYTWQLWHKRAGAVLVNTTAPTTITASTMAVTPASMANIQPGTQLVLSAGTGATETVTVLSVTATTFTATFANGHSGAYTIVSAPLVSLAYSSGAVTETALVPHQFTVPSGTVLLPGDVITLARVSSDSTGLASPAALVALDYTLARIPYGRN